MSTIPQRVASAFAVLCGHYGEVTELARQREQSRQSLYRESETVVEAVDGAAARAQIDDLQRQLAERQAEVNTLETRLKHAVEITADKQQEFATVAQAEGVSLSVARRLLQVMTGPRRRQGVATLGRATLKAGKKAGPLLQVLDEVVRPKATQGSADEIFLDANPS
jgi:chromosome segregation ATPase